MARANGLDRAPSGHRMDMEVLLASLVIGMGIAVVLFFVASKGGRWVVARAKHEDHLAQEVETLDYAVPEGVDPAVVVAALSVNGLDAAADNTAGRQLVHIACSPADDGAREQARDVIAGIGTTTLDMGAPFDPRPVRFVDER